MPALPAEILTGYINFNGVSAFNMLGLELLALEANEKQGSPMVWSVDELHSNFIAQFIFISPVAARMSHQYFNNGLLCKFWSED